MLERHTGTSFNNYKKNTIYRRISKRILELKQEGPEGYLSFLEKYPAEIEELYSNVLIGVTSFFRDPQVFRFLEKKMAELVDRKQDNEGLRIWIPGCSTGEEPYSVGMVIASILSKKQRTIPVQIFATDINERSLQVARKGIYHSKNLAGIPAGLLENYFIRHNGYLEISKNVRSMILFSRHDLTHNPPFLKLDLIVCRNLLIYFNNRLQEYIFPVFYSALKPNGYLILGKSETIGQFSNLFSTANNQLKIYQRKAGNALQGIRFTPVKAIENTSPASDKNELSISEMVKDTIFSLFRHPYVVINNAMDIQEIGGEVGRYLGLKQGKMNANLLKMANKDLKIELRKLVNKCSRENHEVAGELQKVRAADGEQWLKIIVRPLLHADSPNEFYIVIFEQSSQQVRYKKNTAPVVEESASQRIQELEAELEATKEDLHLFVERLENTNAELQSLNEEMQSTIEELKISNEELETTNEELQSTNEEINIAYTELRAAYEKLESQEELLNQSQANINAMMANTMQAFILIDKNFRIITFNQVTTQILKRVFNTDISAGASFKSIISKEGLELFANGYRDACRGKFVSGEKYFKNKQGEQFYLLFNFSPVVRADTTPECISLSILDISELKEIKRELHKSEILMDSVFHSADIGIAIVDSKGLLVKVNDGLCKLLGYRQHEITGMKYLDLVAADQKRQARVLHQKLLAGEKRSDQRRIIRRNGQVIDTYVTNNAFIDDQGNRFLVKTLRDISAESQLKNLLEEAEKAVQMGGFEYDVKLKRMICTEELYRVYGVKAKDKQRPTLNRFITWADPKYRPVLRAAIMEAEQRGIHFDKEIIIRTAEGDRKWVRVTATARKTASRVTSLVGTVQDITRSKESELQLKRLSYVARKTNNAVIITDSKGKIQWVNESFEKMTGWNLQEVIGKKPGTFLQGEQTDKGAINEMTAQLSKHKPVSTVLLNYRKDGSVFWINMDIAPVFKDNELINFIGLGTDITEVLKAREEQKLKESLEQQQQLFDAIAMNFPGGIIGVLDKEFNYVYVGGAELNKLGLKRESLIGEHLFDSISEGGNRDAEPHLKKTFEGEGTVFEESIRGSTYSIHAVPLFGPTNAVENILVVLHNITERRKSENEIWAALNKQRELNELKSKFVSIASHEFRTPLSGILSSAYLIAKYSRLHEEERVQKHTERITSAVSSLTDILNDFLSIGKIEEGKLENNVTTFDIKEFCNKITEDFINNLKKNQTIVFEHTGRNAAVKLDKQHLSHILVNLISNAIKYSGEGKRIWVSSSVTNKAVEITIRDEGIGIPEDDQPHLFQTFFRANNTNDIQGTGMGLHIVKRYLEVMGGTIAYTSKLDAGTTFVVSFPQ